MVGDVLRSDQTEVIIARGQGSHGLGTGVVEILSFSSSVGERPGDRHTLDSLLDEGGEWAERMSDDWTSEGHLLIVGETEIIPAFSHYWDLRGSDHGRVEYTDRDYASTTGDANYPELSMGRIIGENAERLRVPIQASIDIARGDHEFDNSDAYAVSGPRRGASGEADSIDFAANRSSAAGSLRGEGYSVEESHCPTQTRFFIDAQNQDVIYLGGHGSSGSLSVLAGSDSIGWDEVWDNFNPRDTRPLIYVASCLTGRYAAGRSFAEAFLFRGASGYVGATEVGIWPWAGRLSENYFSLLEPDETVGSALKHAKRHRLGVNTYSYDPNFNRYTCAAFHLYGDPKLEPTWLAGSAADLPMSSQYAGASSSRQGTGVETSSLTGPLSSVDVTIPDYQVTTLDGEDHVAIPGGEIVVAAYKPLVPSFSVQIDYPEGQRVQDVTLVQRGGLKTDSGLNIPDAIPAIAGNRIAPLQQQPPEGTEPWPDRDFEWTIIQNPDDTTTLVISIYPFYYNSSTTAVRFYKNYTFDIQHTTTAVEITRLLTDRHVYEQGQTVVANLYLLSASDNPVDVIVDAIVIPETPEAAVHGLPLRTLSSMGGYASLSLEWDSAGFVPGNYVLEVAIREANGALLDRETQAFALGVSAGKVTDFTAAPGCFDVGDQIDTSLTFSNTGTVVISGTAVIKVQDSDGETVKEFKHDVADLAPDASTSFDDVWDTSGVEEGRYGLVGYVLYDGAATHPGTAIVKSRLACYDFNGDRQIGVDDVLAVASRWRLTADEPDPDQNPATPNYEPQYDVVYDRIINIQDIMTVVVHWGETY